MIKSEIIRKRVLKARDKQKKRFENTKTKVNSEMSVRDIDNLIDIPTDVKIF